ncbi:phosphotransferase family protein [Paenibacillus elgii]|uniref:phosphotransferase family protein n=1 Tax=Paenibacillus elgii TaxID=189691 RepID=UPI00203F3AD8|nr:aminoglycoside phosphotransferase family protein [Paenibacillus elgii]MCM3268626.1 phosphotransferase [Paenibacillus elgii]
MLKISEGRTAEIFEQEPGKILKLYRSGFPPEAIRYEYEMNQAIASCGVPAPRTYDLIHFEQRDGIVFERVEGSTFLSRMVQYPDDLDRLSKAFADLHYQVHSYKLDENKKSSIVKQKVILARNIQNAWQLSDDVKKKIIDVLERLPDGDCLCHGDFHPDNVIVGERRWVIDWMTGMVGNPAGDVARTVLLFRFGTLPDEAPRAVKEALQLMSTKISRIYLERYLSCSGLPFSDIDEWMLPIAAARLSEWIPDREKQLLLNLIEERLS